MSTLPRTSAAELSDGLHRGSEREVITSWQACCHCDCRLGGGLRGGLLSRNVVYRAYSGLLVFSAVLRPFGFGWVSPQPVYPVPAAEALGEIHDQRVVEPLIIRLQDDDSLVRSQSARVLREIGDPKAIQSLIQAFGLERYFDSDIPKVMPKLGFTAIDPLINILGNENTAIRRDATIALSSFGPSATG